MMSCRLCAAILLEALLLLFSMPYLVAEGTLTFAAIISTCVALLLINASVVVLAYGALRGYAVAFGRQCLLAGASYWRCTILELLALFVTFLVLQPLERLWMGKDAIGKLPLGQSPVLLVHGYLCNRGLWWWMRKRLRSRNVAVATINLEPPLADLNRLALQLGQRIDALLKETGAAKLVLITHSMGGLVSRAYLQANGAARVDRLLMLAAPTHGTYVARLSFGANARQMRPQSRWLRSLNAQPLPSVPICNFWSCGDEILLPPDTAHMEGVPEIVFEDLGHMAMVFSSRVFQCLEAELARAPCR